MGTVEAVSGDVLTIESLLATPHLGLTLLGGGAGAGRPVSWLHVSEIEDVPEWLDGGELILSTGLGLAKTEEGQVRYVERLAAANASGLAVGWRSSGITAGLVARADDLGFPVMRVAPEVPYTVFSRFVAAANHSSTSRRLATQVQLFDSLRGRVMEDLSTAELFERLSAISGFTLYVVGESGRSALPGLPDAPADLVDAIPGIADRSPAITGGYGVPVPLAGPTPAYVLALEPEDRHIGVIAARHVATIAALEIVSLHREREQERRAGAEALSELMNARLDVRESRRRLDHAGFGGGPLLLVALRNRHGQPPAGEALFNRLGDSATPCLMLTTGETLLALVPDDAQSIEKALDGLPLCAGASEPFTDVTTLPMRRVQAMWAVDGARARATGGLVRFGNNDNLMMWLPQDAAVLQAIAQRTLGPLVDYDADHNAELVRTLRVYLEHDRRASAAAAELRIHKHTLQYRLRRISELTGRRPSNVESLAEFWLALRAQTLVEPSVLRSPAGDA